jgi:hypothetical protein
MAEARKETPTPEVFGPEEALARIVTEMQKPEGEKLYTVSDVTPQEIFGISTVMLYADAFKSKIITDWVRKFLLLRISRLRLGRRENIIIATGIKEVSERKKGAKIQDLYAGLR